MNIFTKDDYRKIQAWLKANSIKDSDLTSVNDTIPEEDTLVLVQKINGILSNVKISIKDLLNSTLSKIIIDTIIANAVKINNTLTVTASKVKIDNEKGTTLQDVLDYFEGNKLNRHTDDTFDGNLTVKKNITIEGNIKSHDDTITVEADLEATGEITDGQGNMLSDVNDASKGWKIEYQDPQQDEPTVRAKYVLKDYRGVPKGSVIKIYKDSAITNVYLGTVEDTCNPNTGEVTKNPIHDNNEALSIVYRLDTGKYSLVNVPIKMFTTEAEFDKYRGLGVTSNGQVFIKLASDVESSNYLHFNELGEIAADGIETRVLKDLGDIITSIAGDGTMWGQYKKEEGTKDSPINETSRWGQYKQAEADRSELLNTVSSKVSQLEQEQIQGGVYDVSAHNGGIRFESLQALLSSSNLDTLIPTSVRHGGMSIRFIQSSDNKYVQYRLMANEWSTNTKDWAISDESVYIENPEFVYVKTDNEGKILWAIKPDGSIYYGADVPQQIKNYINKKIADLSLDGYEDIVAFLNGSLRNDTTLKVIIDNINSQIPTKVDKIEGKSLIDTEYAASQLTMDDAEYLQVTTDSENKILEGIKQDGTKVIRTNLEVKRDTNILGSMEISGVLYNVIENPEYLAAWIDAEDKIIFGIKTDGNIYIHNIDFLNRIKNNQEAIDEINSYLINFNNLDINALLSTTVIDNPEFIEVTTDSEGKLLAGRTYDGIAFENVGFITPKVSINGHIIENVEDPEGRNEITIDTKGKIISYRDNNGVKHENVGIETNNVTVNNLNLTESGMTRFQQALKDSGFNPPIPIDWSGKQYIHIPNKPTCAVINITGIDELPQHKGANSHAWMEFWDKNGNYFKKRVILDAQGRSSLMQHKKNFSADFCEDEWEGDETTTIKIGNWVSQDSFHFKAYYTDMFKFANITGYRIWDSFRKTMNITNDKPFKEFFIDDYSSTEGSIDNFTQNSKDEAKCVPDGFPVCVYLNGNFYGIFFWQLKKHRDNYLLDRNKTNNIHLDGEDYANLFNGIINWGKLEIRNPKPKKSKWTLYCMDGTKYDGDNPKELIDSSSENWDSNNISHIKSAEVKENIVALSHYMSDIASYEVVSTSNGNITIGTFRGDYADNINYTKGDWVKSINNYYISLHSSNIGNPISDTSNWINISSNLEILKSEIEKRFGIRWLIDYVILVNLERNGDIFLQNCQWITWGNIDNYMKWIICPYDHDYSFGINSVSSYKFMSPEYGAFGDTATTPIRYVYKYYIEDVRKRWKSLRDAKIIDKDTIMSIIVDLVNSIGNDNYTLEYEKWNESPCCRESGINTKWQLLEMSITYNDFASNWSSSVTYSNGSYVKHGHVWFESQQGNNIGHEPNLEQDTEWWRNVSAKPGFYAAGSEIWDGYSNFFKFKALEDVTITEDESFNDRLIDHYVNAPFKKLYQYYPHESGVFDSLYRIYYWLQEQIEIMDNKFLY